MKFPFLASVILFTIFLRKLLGREDTKSRQANESFWERERRANATRRQSLEHLDYITIPLEQLPLYTLNENEEVQNCIATITSLGEKEIVNFTGFTNTDLKLEYGAANITKLMHFDQNYTLLVRTLQKWAALLYENGFAKEAMILLEFAVSTRSDISASYSLLCKIYHEFNCTEKITDLLTVANKINAPAKEKIVRIVQESCR